MADPREQILRAMAGAAGSPDMLPDGGPLPDEQMPPEQAEQEQGMSAMPVDQAIQFLMGKGITENDLPILAAAVEALEHAGIIPGGAPAGPQGAPA